MKTGWLIVVVVVVVDVVVCFIRMVLFIDMPGSDEKDQQVCVGNIFCGKF